MRLVDCQEYSAETLDLLVLANFIAQEAEQVLDLESSGIGQDAGWRVDWFFVRFNRILYWKIRDSVIFGIHWSVSPHRMALWQWMRNRLRSERLIGDAWVPSLDVGSCARARCTRTNGCNLASVKKWRTASFCPASDQRGVIRRMFDRETMSFWGASLHLYFICY